MNRIMNFGAEIALAAPRIAVRIPEDRVLLPIEFCAVALRASVEGVMNLIEAGELRWAIDLSGPGARRLEVRVHRESFLWLAANEGSNERSKASFPTALAMARSILPASRSTVTSTELMARLFCSHGHITNLLRAGALEQVGRPLASRGVNAVRRVSCASVARFLARRIIK